MDIVELLRDGDRYSPNHWTVMVHAADEIESLRARVTELERDAGRLDYIASNARCDPKMDGNHVWWPTSFNHKLTGPTLRAAIDAAISGEG